MHVYYCAYSIFSQDYVFFIPPPQHYPRARSAFSPSLDECWYGRVDLIFKMWVWTDAGDVMECQCALIKTLYYCPWDSKPWWPSTAEIGTKLLYLPSPEPVVYVVPLSHWHILCKLPLVLAGDYGTIPQSMNSCKDKCFPRGQCDHHKQG